MTRVTLQQKEIEFRSKLLVVSMMMAVIIIEYL